MFDRQTTKQLIMGLEAFRGHDPEEYSALVEPLSEFVFSNNFYNLSEVNKLVEAILAARPETTTMETEPSVTAQLLAGQIKPWIEDIRQKLFHSKSAPFSRIEDAEIWWDKAKKGADEWSKRVDEWSKRWDEWRKRWHEWEVRLQAMLEKYPLMKADADNEGIKRTWHEWKVRWQAMLEKYPPTKADKEGIKKTWVALCKQGIPVEFPTQEDLRQFYEIKRYGESEVGESPEQDEQVKIYGALLDDILEINRVTNFTVLSVKMYILADASPVFYPFTFGIFGGTHSLPSGISLLNRFARVTIRGDETFEDLRSIYRRIRQELGIKRSKRPTIKHSQLYRIVKRRGAIPRQKGTVAFWESVMKEWNDLQPQDKYKTWKGVKLAYERIIAQLERRITTKEATP